MGKHGPLETPDLSTSAALGRANAIVADLRADKPVAEGLVADAKNTLLDELWSGKAASRDTAQHGLVTIYSRSKDAATRAELIGDLFAAGPQGRAALQELMAGAPSTRLTHDDLHDFAASADRPLSERLQLVISKLATEAGRSRAPNDSKPRAPQPHTPGTGADVATLPSEERSSRAGRVVARRTSDPPKPGDALDDVKNTELPHDYRQARALEAGRSAVALLTPMLTGKNEGEREFAVSTLIHLGRTRAAGREVYQEMVRLEANEPQARRSAELIRSAIEDGAGDRPDARTRDRVRGATVSDGWLRAALQSCDAPSILRAAAGREVVAIALGTRTLHEIRERLR